jgi:hypothetical protein
VTVGYVIYGLVETRPGHRYIGRVRYVGFTHNLENRVRAYRRGGGNNFRHKNWLKACPEFGVLVLGRSSDRSLALAMEIEWIAKLGTYKSDYGLNALPGGGGLPPGPRYDWRGRVRPASHSLAISKALKGGKQSPAANAKRSATQSGKTHSTEWNSKVSASLKKNQDVVSALRKIAQNKSAEHQANLAKSAASRRWKCDECGLTGNAGSIGNHQRGSGHVGRSRNEVADPSS